MVVTVGRLAGITNGRCGGDCRLVIDPFVAVPIDPAVLRSPIPPVVVVPTVPPLIAALIDRNPDVAIAGSPDVDIHAGGLGRARIADFIPNLSSRCRTDFGWWS